MGLLRLSDGSFGRVWDEDQQEIKLEGKAALLALYGHSEDINEASLLMTVDKAWDRYVFYAKDPRIPRLIWRVYCRRY